MDIAHQLFILFMDSLIVWSLGSLLVYETGPFNLFLSFRERVGVRVDTLAGECRGKNVFAEMLCCFKCTSFWVSIPIALLTVRVPPLELIGWIFAIRTVAIMMDRWING